MAWHRADDKPSFKLLIQFNEAYMRHLEDESWVFSRNAGGGVGDDGRWWWYMGVNNPKRYLNIVLCTIVRSICDPLSYHNDMIQ